MSKRAASKHMQRGWGAPDFTGLFAGLILLGVAVGVALALVLPWLWSWIKPIIHQWTA